MRNQYQFYLDNRVVLLKKHLNKFLVIKGKKVIASYDTHDIAQVEGIKCFPDGGFLIQHCTPIKS